MIMMVVAVFYIKNKIDQIQQQVEEKINNFVRPAEMAMNVGTSIAATAMDTFRKFNKKKRK